MKSVIRKPAGTAGAGVVVAAMSLTGAPAAYAESGERVRQPAS